MGIDYRLKNKKLIEELFQGSSSIFLYPMRINFLLKEDIDTHQVLFSVSKKRFPRAVDRNKIKRLCRDVYRTNYQSIGRDNSTKKVVMGIIYVGKTILSFQEINHAFGKLLIKVNSQLMPKEQ